MVTFGLSLLKQCQLKTPPENGPRSKISEIKTETTVVLFKTLPDASLKSLHGPHWWKDQSQCDLNGKSSLETQITN